MHWIDCQNQGCWFLVVICNKLKLIMTFLTPKEQFLKIYWTYCLKIMLLFYLQQVNHFIQIPWAYYTALSMKWKWLQTFLVVFVWGLRLNSSLKRGAVKVKDGNGCGFRFDMSWHLKVHSFRSNSGSSISSSRLSETGFMSSLKCLMLVSCRMTCVR